MLFAALCGVAAFAVERALRALRRPTRWPWVIALVVAAAWPAVAPFVLTAKVAANDGTRAGVTMQVIPVATASASVPLDLAQLETPLRLAWAIGSALLLLQVALAIRTIRRVQRNADSQDVHGESILVNEHMGPAVIGVLRPRIVVPTWLLELDDSLRELILRHEREHCRAGDPALVWLGVLPQRSFRSTRRSGGLRAGCDWPWRSTATRARCATTVTHRATPSCCCSSRSNRSPLDSFPRCRTPLHSSPGGSAPCRIQSFASACCVSLPGWVSPAAPVSSPVHRASPPT